METQRNKYHDGKIYRICDVGYTKSYYGSTTQALSMRLAGHRRNYRLHKEHKCNKVAVYDLFDEFGVKNCKIELVEDFPCETRNELQRQEGHHIRQNECINKIRLGRTSKEYYEHHKDTIIPRVRQYYHD